MCSLEVSQGECTDYSDLYRSPPLFLSYWPQCDWPAFTSKGRIHLLALTVRRVRKRVRRGAAGDFLPPGFVFATLRLLSCLCGPCMLFFWVCFCRDWGPPGRKGPGCRCELGSQRGTERHIVLGVLGELGLQSDPVSCHRRTTRSTVTAWAPPQPALHLCLNLSLPPTSLNLLIHSIPLQTCRIFEK